LNVYGFPLYEASRKSDNTNNSDGFEGGTTKDL
jgi:hypothetical protein